MFRSIPSVPLIVVAALLVGCSDSDGDGPSGSPPTEDSPDGREGDDAANPGVGSGGDDPDAVSAPSIDIDTYETLLEEVFGIYGGERWDRTPLSLARFGPLFESPDGPTESDEGWTAAVGPALCRSGGGELALALPAGLGNYPWRARFEACVPADPDATGLAFVDGYAEGEFNWHTSVRSDDLVWTRASGERVSFTGELRTIPYESRSDYVTSFVTADAYQRVLDADESVTLFAIDRATSTSRGGTIVDIVDVAELSGGFTYRSSLTGGQALTARIPLVFAYRWDARTPAPDGVAPEDLDEGPFDDVRDGSPRSDEQWAAVERTRRRWAFVSGMLELEAEDGSRLMLDADTGDLDTVRVTLDAGRGERAEEREITWPGRWYRALGISLPSARAEETGTGTTE